MSQQYVALVMDEPIPGLPSVRVYGPFDSSRAALDELDKYRVRDRCPHATTGYLLLRGPDKIAGEVALAPPIE